MAIGYKSFLYDLSPLFKKIEKLIFSKIILFASYPVKQHFCLKCFLVSFILSRYLSYITFEIFYPVYILYACIFGFCRSKNA